jgi:CRP-like cAMP-binding protein
MRVKRQIQQSMLGTDLLGDELETLEKIANEKTYYKNDIIFSENEPGNIIYILTEGRVCIERRQQLHRRLLPKQIFTVRKGQIFGEMAFIEKGPRSATARARSNVTVVTLQQSDVEVLLEQNRELGYKLMRNLARILSNRLRRMNEQWLSAVPEDFPASEFEYH